MISILQNLLRAAERRLSDGAQHLFLWIGFRLSVWLIGMTGVGFVITSAYLGLASVMGAGWAAFVLGLGLIALMGGLWALATKHEATSPPPAKATPVPTATASAEASTVAFTAAFVLGRYLNRDRPDDDRDRPDDERPR